jgi:glycosyltransferase involved in cell wall biosynthesis
MATKLTVLHTESSTGWGGQEIRIMEESQRIINRGYKVIIAAPKNSTIFKRATESGIDVFHMEFNKKNPLSFLRMLLLINREKVDILNTHSSSDSWIATISAKLSRRKPKIIRTRHLSTPISKSVLSRLIYDVFTDAVITTGNATKERMIKYNKFNSEKILSIPGDGPQASNLKRKVEEMNIHNRVFFLGHREDIPEIIASLDVVVHPSYESEGVPQSILQAMAMEKPVIASNIGAIGEIVIDNETGLLLKPKKPALIAEKIAELYSNPDKRVNFGREARSFVKEKFSMENMIDNVERLYETLIRQSKQ